jgi:hypothetical protein
MTILNRLRGVFQSSQDPNSDIEISKPQSYRRTAVPAVLTISPFRTGETPVLPLFGMSISVFGQEEKLDRLFENLLKGVYKNSDIQVKGTP